MQRAADASEYLDRPISVTDRAAALADIDRLNAWFGGYAFTLREVRRVAQALPAGRPLTVIDVGGGRGDLARRLVRWGRQAGRPVRVLVVDRDPGALGLAREAAAGYPEITLVGADAAALPVREGTIDVAVASLTLHHLEPDAAAAMLAGMGAAARAIVVNDLLRTRLSLGLVWLATRLLARHPFAWHDGPLSVRRAYSPDELRVLGEKAGLPRLTVRRYPLLGRVVATAR